MITAIDRYGSIWYDQQIIRNSSPCQVTFASGSRLKSIEYGAFRFCWNLKEIEIPANVEVLGEECFMECTSLSHITFTNESVLKKIQPWTFSITNLKEIEILATVEVLCEACFKACYSLSRITFARDSHLKRIDKGVFTGCQRLREIDIPASLEVLGEKCFGPKEIRGWITVTCR